MWKMNGMWLLVLALLFSGCSYFENGAKSTQLQAQLDSTVVQFQRLRQEHNRVLAEYGQQVEVGFEVQIGAFRYFDLNKYSESLVNMRIRESGDVNRYVLGSFTSLEEAKEFLKDIRIMGVQDAFIGGVINGKRVTVKEAEEAANGFYGDFD